MVAFPLLHRPLSSQASSSSRLALKLSSSSRSFLLPRRSLSSSSASFNAVEGEEGGDVEPSIVRVNPEAQIWKVPKVPVRRNKIWTRSLPPLQPMELRGTLNTDNPTHREDEDDLSFRVWSPMEYEFDAQKPPAMDRASNDDLFKWARNAGSEWKWPTKGKTNWLGGDVPYPENPFFKPSPPLSCDLQAEVYEAYTQFPPAATSIFRINALSTTYGISKDRIRGIIKTGQIGESWKRLDIPRVRTFTRGMESFLCVPPHASKSTRSLTSPSPAITEFQKYLASRIDMERDEETVKIEQGERNFRTEDSGFVPHSFQGGNRLGSMSWEFADEGQLPTTFKIDMEKPLRPPPTLPHFPAKVVDSGKKAVWNFVNVGDKFAGQGWDGALQRRNHAPPSRKGAARRFLPLVTSRVNLSGTRDPTITSAAILSQREKKRRAYADKMKMNEAGIFTPEQVILEKMRKPGREFTHIMNAKIMDAKRTHREEMLDKKARKRVYDRVADVKAFKARVKGLSYDPK